VPVKQARGCYDTNSRIDCGGFRHRGNGLEFKTILWYGVNLPYVYVNVNLPGDSPGNTHNKNATRRMLYHLRTGQTF
jgi:hypothetical protein